MDKDDVMTIPLVNICSIPFAEAVSADVGIAENVTDCFQIALDLPHMDWKQKSIGGDLFRSGVIAEKVVNIIGYGERPPLPRLFLGDVQTVAVSVSDDVTKPQPEDIPDP